MGSWEFIFYIVWYVTHVLATIDGNTEKETGH